MVFHLLAKLLLEFYAKLEGDGGTLQLFRAKDERCLIYQRSIGASFNSDQEILAAYRLIAGREGIFCEPSSAAGRAGLLKAKAAGQLPKGKKIVITVTGNGLKDVQWALDVATALSGMKATAFIR